MKLPELKELAKQLGLRGVSTMRKGDLIATLQAARSGGEAPAGVTVRAPKAESAAAQRTSSIPPAASRRDAVRGVTAPPPGRWPRPPPP